MKTKIISIVLSFAMVLTVVGFTGVETADAQSVSFPEGCASALGYSVITGHTCNGESTATKAPMPGCATALGYSVTTGEPCSGSSVVLNYLAGCSSIYGYSTRTGQACNGTSVASFPLGTPGLPRTGTAGNALVSILLMTVSGLVAIFGLAYLSKQSKEA